MPYTIRPATETDAPQIVALLNAHQAVATTVDAYRRQERLRPREHPGLRLVAVTRDGALAGIGVANHDPQVDPVGLFRVRVQVDPAHRRRGIGQALYSHMEHFALGHRASRIESTVQAVHADSLAWASRRGFTIASHVFDSTLNLTRWNPDDYRGAVDFVASGGVRFTTLADEGITNTNLRRFHALYTELLRETPGHRERTPMPVEVWLCHVRTDPAWNPEFIFLAVQGSTWVGLTRVVTLNRGELYNDFTGVLPSHRNRGIAFALKVLALRAALESGAERIRTDNHSENGPMLAVNSKLGYLAGDGLYNLVKHVLHPG